MSTQIERFKELIKSTGSTGITFNPVTDDEDKSLINKDGNAASRFNIDEEGGKYLNDEVDSVLSLNACLELMKLFNLPDENEGEIREGSNYQGLIEVSNPLMNNPLLNNWILSTGNLISTTIIKEDGENVTYLRVTTQTEVDTSGSLVISRGYSSEALYRLSVDDQPQSLIDYADMRDSLTSLVDNIHDCLSEFRQVRSGFVEDLFNYFSICDSVDFDSARNITGTELEEVDTPIIVHDQLMTINNEQVTIGEKQVIKLSELKVKPGDFISVVIDVTKITSPYDVYYQNLVLRVPDNAVEIDPDVLEYCIRGGAIWYKVEITPESIVAYTESPDFSLRIHSAKLRK